MGDEVPLQDTAGRSGGTGSGVGAADLRSLRDQDRARRGEQGSCAYSCERPAESGAERDHETDQGAHGELAV